MKSKGPRRTPAKLVEELELDQIRDLISCPFRYWKRSIEKKSPSLSPFLFARKVFEASIRKALEEKQQTKKDLLRDDLFRIVSEIGLDLRLDLDPELLEASFAPVWTWWKRIGAKAIPLIVGRSFALDLKGWKIRGRIPLVFRSPEARFDQIALPVLEHPFDPWTDHRLENDLEPPLVHLGARQIGLETNSVQIQIISIDGKSRIVDPIIPPARTESFLVLAAAVREAILGHCFRPQSWYPNRLAGDCSSALCRDAKSCLETFGGTVRD